MQIQFRLITIILTVLALGGCATSSSNPQDPWENMNRKSYEFTIAIDKAVIKPVAKGYASVMPDFMETGISNIFSNLGDIPNSLNNLLQGKPLDFLSDLGRFVINSTLGIAGMWDPASSMGLVKHNEDFGQTLAVWGVSDGPYIWIPLLGPSTLRDSLGLPVDSQFNLVNHTVDHVPTRNQLTAIELIDKRVSLLPLDEQLESASDEYSFVRDAYLQNRKFKVYDGNLPFEDDFECEEEDEEDCDF